MPASSPPLVLVLILCIGISFISPFGSNCGGEYIDTRGHDTRPFTAKSNNQLKDFKLAFIGDQDLGTAPLTLLQQIKQWGSHVVFHSGDFDYHDSPPSFFQQRDSVFDLGYPYLTTMGNHELVMWNEGYESGLAERMKYIRNDTDLHCWGQIGVNMACNYGGEEGVIMIMSGVGTCGKGHEEFMETTFRQFPKASWKLCMWHKVQHLYQTYDNVDETGYGVYETCRRHGAIVMTAHTHSYSRSVAMSDFTNQVIADPDKLNVRIAPGRSFAVVCGLGGHKIEGFVDDLESNPWWAANAALDNGTDYGALYCTLNVGGTPGLAECFFQDIQGVIWDKFNVWNNNSETDIVDPPSDCTPEKRDTQIQSIEDEHDSHRDLSTDFLVISSPSSSSVTLSFRNLHIPTTKVISHAYLQFLCATSFIGNMTLRMQVKNPLTGHTSHVMSHSISIVENLHEELWITPNFAHLLHEVISSSSSSGITDTLIQNLEVTLMAEGDERLSFSYKQSPHLAPSLFIQMTSAHC